MIERFTPEEQELIKWELAEQEKIIKRSTDYYRSRRLLELRDYWKYKQALLTTDSKTLTDIFKKHVGKLPNICYQEMIGTVLKLSKNQRIRDIPECDISACIEAGKHLTNGFFSMLRVKMAEEKEANK